MTKTVEGVCLTKAYNSCDLSPGNISWWIRTYWGYLLLDIAILIIIWFLAFLKQTHSARRIPCMNLIRLLFFTASVIYLVCFCCAYFALSDPKILLSTAYSTTFMAFAATATLYTGRRKMRKRLLIPMNGIPILFPIFMTWII